MALAISRLVGIFEVGGGCDLLTTGHALAEVGKSEVPVCSGRERERIGRRSQEDFFSVCFVLASFGVFYIV